MRGGASRIDRQTRRKFIAVVVDVSGDIVAESLNVACS